MIVITRVVLYHRMHRSPKGSPSPSGKWGMARAGHGQGMDRAAAFDARPTACSRR